MAWDFDEQEFHEIARAFGLEEPHVDEFLNHPGFETDPINSVVFFSFPDPEGVPIWIDGYGDVARRIIPLVGGSIVFMGRAEQFFADIELPFDGLSVSRFPSRRAFAEYLLHRDIRASLEARRLSGIEERLVLMTDVLAPER